MNEEMSRILKMVEEGKISSEKAQELIEALNSKNNTPSNFTMPNDNDISNKNLVIKVSSHNNDVVNLKLPIKFIKTMIKVAGKIPMTENIKGMEGVDLNVISDAIDNNLCGKILDVNSGDGDKVEISIE